MAAGFDGMGQVAGDDRVQVNSGPSSKLKTIKNSEKVTFSVHRAVGGDSRKRAQATGGWSSHDRYIGTEVCVTSEL